MPGFDDVRQFHGRFGLPVSVAVREIDPEVIDFRVKFMREELDEFVQACEVGDHAGMFDALIDLVYVAYGTAHFLGYPWDEGWAAVHEANMRKVRATSAGDSKRGSHFDVIKPEGWVAPDIHGLLASSGWPINQTEGGEEA